MNESFAAILAVGGKANSLGRAGEVVEIVLQNKLRLHELYECVFNDDAWIRMRAIDSIEKICRVHPEWILPYIDGFCNELSTSTQPSIQWHLAQIYREVTLTDRQKKLIISWLKQLLHTTDVDWIVAANAMDTLVKFTLEGDVHKFDMIDLLKVQHQHKSKSVVKRANKLLGQFL